jgi:hypothetical protein
MSRKFDDMLKREGDIRLALHHRHERQFNGVEKWAAERERKRKERESRWHQRRNLPRESEAA